MASYGKMGDPVVSDEASFASAKVVTKFCSMGFVSSRKWTFAYLTILDGVVRMYESKEACEANNQNTIMEIVLQRGYRASPIKKKDYSQDPLKIIEFYCFYIEVDEGIFAALRKLKVGCSDLAVAEKLCRTINANSIG